MNALISDIYSLDSFNFGPYIDSNKSVKDLVDMALTYWPGEWTIDDEFNSPHEAQKLHLNIDKSFFELNWSPRWNFGISVEKTINWYKKNILLVYHH